MNKLITLLLLAASLIACSKATKATTETKVEAAVGEVVVLNKADFITKVFNYEKNPETWAYEGKKPCIIDFYADWCAPCRKVSPILKELAGVYKDKLVVYKINVDDEGELAALFGIQSIPSLMFVPVEGKPQMSVGAMGREALVSQIDNLLLAGATAP